MLVPSWHILIYLINLFLCYLIVFHQKKVEEVNPLKKEKKKKGEILGHETQMNEKEWEIPGPRSFSLHTLWSSDIVKGPMCLSQGMTRMHYNVAAK